MTCLQGVPTAESWSEFVQVVFLDEEDASTFGAEQPFMAIGSKIIDRNIGDV